MGEMAYLRNAGIVLRGCHEVAPATECCPELGEKFLGGEWGFFLVCEDKGGLLKKLRCCGGESLFF